MKKAQWQRPRRFAFMSMYICLILGLQIPKKILHAKLLTLAHISEVI